VCEEFTVNLNKHTTLCCCYRKKVFENRLIQFIMKKRCLTHLIILIAGMAMAWPVQAATIGYWDFNSDNLARSQGTSGTMSVTLFNVSVFSYEAFASGTTENALPSVPAGSSLAFFDFAEAFEWGVIEINHLDFTGYQDIQLSFASRQSNLGVMELFSVQYKTGSEWETFSHFDKPTSSWATESFDLSSIGALNNIANASLRIHFIEFAQLFEVLEFDNILVTATAIPEPRHVIWITGFLALGLVTWRRFIR
jgi:hypothetical protein